MFCPNCGKEITHAGAFCVFCGGKLPTMPQNPPAPAAPVEQPVATAEQPVAPVEQPIAPVEQPIAPVEQPAAPVQPPVAPVEQPAPPVQPPVPPMQPPVTPYPTQPPAAPAQEPTKKSVKIGLVIGIAAVVIVAIVAAILLYPKLSGGKKTGGSAAETAGTAAESTAATGSKSDAPAKAKGSYALEDYLIVEYEGFDGSATAIVSLDRDKLMRDICADRKVDPSFLNGGTVPKSIEEVYDDVLNLEAFAEVVDHEITTHYSGPEYKGLKNGDTFTVIALYDEYHGASGIELGQTTVTVSGLEAMPERDFFEGVRIVATNPGKSGDNIIEVVYEGDIEGVESSDFTVDPFMNARNGETVTVSLLMDADWYESMYSIRPMATEKEFVMEGLAENVASFDEIPKGALQGMKDRSKAKMIEELDEISQEKVMLEYTDPECIGYVFLAQSDPADYDDNHLYLVFRSLVTSPDDEFPPTVYFYATDRWNLVDSEEIFEDCVRGSSSFSVMRLGGQYVTGIDDPYEFVSDLIDKAERENLTISYGGEVELYSHGDGYIESLADISEAALVPVRSYTVNMLRRALEDEGLTLTEEPKALGEYLIKALNSNYPDAEILYLMYSVTYTNGAGAAVTRWVPCSYQFVRTVKNGLILENNLELMSWTDGQIGYPGFLPIHNAILASGQQLGEVSFSDSIAALAG